MVKLKPSGMCFGCGKENDCGLKLDISAENGKAWAKVIFKEHHQGWSGIVHGGVIVAAIDEVMAYAFGSLGVKTGVTAEMRVRFKRPVKVGEEYLVKAEVVEFSGRKAVLKGSIEREGVQHAVGEGIYVVVREVRV